MAVPVGRFKNRQFLDMIAEKGHVASAGHHLYQRVQHATSNNSRRVYGAGDLHSQERHGHGEGPIDPDQVVELATLDGVVRVVVARLSEEPVERYRDDCRYNLTSDCVARLPERGFDGRELKYSRRAKARDDEDRAIVLEGPSYCCFDEDDSDERPDEGEQPDFVLHRDLFEPGEGREGERFKGRLGAGLTPSREPSQERWESAANVSPGLDAKRPADGFSLVLWRRPLVLLLSLPHAALIRR